MKVYKAINAIQSALSKTGIGKDHKNAQQGYSFRGIDDVYNALAPLLAEHQLVILPRVLARTESERATKAGGALFSVVVDVEFDFISAEDASKHTVRIFGEAMDSADKATNKALSAAYKYACLEAFAIPTQGENDADATTHEVAARPQMSAAVKQTFAPRPTPSVLSGETASFVPKAVSVKQGEKNGKTWVKYGVLSPDEVWYGTFDEVIGNAAQEAKENNTPFTFNFKSDGKFITITGITAAPVVREEAQVPF